MGLEKSRLETHLLLLSSELNDPLVDGSLRDESVDRDLSRLTQSMSSIHRLSVVTRVPIVVVWGRRRRKVVSFQCFGGREERRDEKGSQKMTVSAAVKLIPNPPARVERQKTKISGLEGKKGTASEFERENREREKGEERDSLGLPRRDHIPSIRDLGVSIESKVLVLTVDEVLLDEVDHLGHLEVEQNSMSSLLEFSKEEIQSSEFGRVEDESLHLWHLHRRLRELIRPRDADES